MADTTDLGTIYYVGQRRTPGGTFPPPAGGGGGGLPDIIAVEPEEVELNPDGSVRVGPINFGDPFTFGGVGTVTLIQDGSMSDLVGFIHSHNSGGHLPSDGNANDPGDLQVLESLVTASNNPSIRMYIVAPNQGPAEFTPYNQINVYDQSNARSSRDSNTPGPEVNPEGQACPS